jgi:hypothetical protein
MADASAGAEAHSTASVQADQVDASAQEPKVKKSRTNTPWTPAEELRLKQMRDAGNSWSEIAKVGKHNQTLSLLTKQSMRCVELTLTEHYRPSLNEQKVV